MTRKTTARTGPDPRARAAVRGGVFSNYVDQVDIFLPVIALAPVTANLYGPGQSSLLAGVTFVATLFGRPVGALLFGPLADRAGRSTTAQIAVAGMAATTLLMALVPGHEVLGPGTLALMVVLRLLGGIFLGGQYSAAVPLAMEWSPASRRGLVSGVVMAMSPLANASIAALTTALIAITGLDAYGRWGWRVVFGVGGLLAVGLLLHYRTRVRDTAAPAGSLPSAPGRGHPLRELFTGTGRGPLLRMLVLMTGLWLFTYMAVSTLTQRLTAGSAAAPEQVPLVMLAATLVSALAMALCGHLSSVTGRARFFRGFAVPALLGAPALYLWAVGTSSFGGVVVGAALLQVLTVSAYGPVGAYLSEQFPAGIRSTGYGAAYSLSIVLPACYPFFLPVLQRWWGEDLAVAVVLAVAAVLVWLGAGARAARAGYPGAIRGAEHPPPAASDGRS